MDWPGSINPNAARARSRVGFKLKAFDPPVADVPEPSSLLALLPTGVFACVGKSRSKKENLT